MRVNADKEVRDQLLAAASMESIEARAQKQYERDLKAAQIASDTASGSWVCLHVAGSHVKLWRPAILPHKEAVLHLFWSR